jgi:hypothetical protein
MKTFNRKNPTSTLEKLLTELLDELMKITLEYLNKKLEQEQDQVQVLSALQSASLTYMYNVTHGCAKNFIEKSAQLDYVEEIKEDVLKILNDIKRNIKSIDLN